MPKLNPTRQFLLCVTNKDYAASLEVRKVYQTMPDAVAESRGFIRVIDESGDDYLYPSKYFVAVDLPQSAVKVFAGTS
jgi:hypothetical protein